MILELGVIAVGYVGSEIYSQYKKKRSKKLLTVINAHSQKSAIKRAKPQTLLPQSKHGQKTALEKHTDHFLKWSLVSVGLTLVSGSHPVLFAASIGSLLYINTPLLRQSYHALLKKGEFGHDALTTVMFTIGLVNGYHFALAVGGFLYFVGSKLMIKVRGNSEAFYHDIFENRPQSAWVVKDGVEVEMPLHNIQLDDTIIVRTGEVIPVDGVIVEGQALIDQQALTGEFQPAEKMLGDPVFASTLLLGGQIYIRVQKSGEETAIAQIAQILDRAIDYQNKIQLKGQMWADKSSLPFLLAGGLSYLTLGPSGSIVMMNSRPGNGIRVLGALDTLNHIKLASQHGILIKDGGALETLKEVDVVIFDKTGTLTLECPQVGRIFQYDTAYKTTDILRYTAAVEKRLSHPIARAIIEKSQIYGLDLPVLDDSTYEVGYGLTAYLEGKLIHVGSANFMKLENVPLSHQAQTDLDQTQREGNTLVFLAIEQKLVGGIEIEASLRTEIPTLLQQLRQQGVAHISIVSGDYEQPTKALADLLQMDSHFSQILPENKASIVQQFQKQGHTVCFIGDGINDAIAMQQADVAISLTGASSIAIDVAQIVVMQNSLTPIGHTFDISQRLNKSLLYSLGFVSILPIILNFSGLFFFNIGVLGSFLVNNASFLAGLGNVVLPARSGPSVSLQSPNQPLLPETIAIKDGVS